MSDDLISREDTKQAIRHKFKTLAERCEINEVLNSMPSVQPKEKTGKWIIIDDVEQFTAKCSECGKIVDSRAIHHWSKDFSYCGRCGAKMEV